MDIEVGEYVRDRGELLKIEDIINIDEDSVYIKFKEYAGGNTFYKSEIEKWKKSKNIIDLIEKGDFVNGKKVTKINLDRNIDKRKRILCEDSHFDCLDEMYANKDIKSIVTKESFKNAEYRVEAD